MPYLVHSYRLVYDNNTKSYSNTTNVEVTAPGLGGVTTLEYLDTGGSLIPHYNLFVEYFTTKHSYVGGKDLRGVPYHWRLAPGMCT